MPRGALLAVIDFTTAPEDEFNDWYDLEHYPERMRIPGILTGSRWLGVDNPRISIAFYDLDTIEVLRSAPYLAVSLSNASPWSVRISGLSKRLMRAEAVQVNPGDALSPEGAGALLLNAMNVTPEADADFNAWYDQEHLPALAAVPGTLSARRFRCPDGNSHRYFALYHLTGPEVATSEAWKKAANTPWSDRVRPHFRDHIRVLSRPYVRAKA